MTREERTRVEEVLIHLGLDDDGFLIQLREEGLFQEDEVNADQADEIRVAAIMVKELGVNPAGVQVALHLRRRLIALESRATTLMTELTGRKGPR
jgi:hypothetical protein